MKGNIYTLESTPAKPDIKHSLIVTKQLLTITLSLLITLMLPAQQQSAHNIRNVKSNFNSNSYHTIPMTVTTVKTLSVLPGVAPGENLVVEKHPDNRSDIYSPSGSSTSMNARIIENTGNPGNDRFIDNNDGSINNGSNNNGSINNIGSANNHGSMNYISSTNAVNSGNLLLSNSSARLSSFTGRSVNGEYEITWETVLENDIKQYEVEYSLNNKDFQGAGIVNASNKPVYTFKHTTDAQLIMYYRLKVIDTRGGVSYLNPIMVKSTLAKASELMSPTIIRDGVLNITIANAYKNVQLFNSAGIEVFREYLGGRTGNRIGFNLPSLPSGTYFVKLIGTNASITQRVMIM